MAVPSLTNALTFFEQVFDQGRDLLGTDAAELLSILVTLEVVFAGIYLALGSSTELRGLARKLLLIGFFFWVIRNYESLLRTIVDGFLYSGARGGSSLNINFATLRDPDQIFRRGLTLLTPVVNKLFSDWSSNMFGIPSVDTLILLFCIICAVVCYGVIAIHVFITYLEYLLISAAGLILIPFGVFRPTAFISERVFGAIIGFGIKLMILALIIGVSDQFLQTIALPEEVSWQQSFEFLIISLALAVLSFHAPSVALSLLSSTPQLSLGAVTSTAAVGAAATVSGAQLGTGIGTGSARLAIAGAGALTGGMAAPINNQKALSTERGQSSGLKSIAATTIKAGIGAATAPISAVSSSLVERVMHGKDGKSSGTKQTMLRDGYSHTQGGFMGHFRKGKYAVPQYRKSLQKKEASIQTTNQPKKEDPL